MTDYGDRTMIELINKLAADILSLASQSDRRRVLPDENVTAPVPATAKPGLRPRN